MEEVTSVCSLGIFLSDVSEDDTDDTVYLFDIKDLKADVVSYEAGVKRQMQTATSVLRGDAVNWEKRMN